MTFDYLVALFALSDNYTLFELSEMLYVFGELNHPECFNSIIYIFNIT